jgi:DNA-binding CsgD family transcriptional regulator
MSISRPAFNPERHLVGRAREQSALRAELASALAGHGRLVLLGGEAGIGKTSLVRGAIEEAAAQGAEILLGHCYDLSNAPAYGPWRDMFATYSPRNSRPPPPVAFAGGRLEQISDRSALFGEVQQFVAALTAVGPAAIVLEDLHWSDSASVELLSSLALHVRRWPLLLLLTYRADELTRESAFALHLPTLARVGDAIRLELRRFDREGLRALVDARYDLADADAGRLVAYLDQHAEGNPFFVTEVLRALQDDDSLRLRGGQWELSALDRLVVPPLLMQVIDARLARLGEELRTPLAVAAVIGHEIPLEVWGAISGLDDDALITVLERATDAHLIEANRAGTQVHFVHALIRAALYEGILAPRRRTWHRLAAERLATNPKSDPDAVALHFQQAGDARAAGWLERAGEQAQRAYAWLTASERFRSAADLLDGVEGQEETRRRLIFRIAHLLRFSYPTDATAALGAAEALAHESGDVFMVGETQNILGIMECYTDRFRDGLARMADGLTVLENQPPDSVRAANALRAWFTEAIPGKSISSLTEDEEAVRQLHMAGFDHRRCTHPWYLAVAGQLEDALSLGDRFVTTVADIPGGKGGIQVATAYTRHGLGIARAALGEPQTARQEWEFVRRTFAQVEHHVLVAFALLTEARDVAATYGIAEPSVRRHLAKEAGVALARAGGALRPGFLPEMCQLNTLLLDGRWDEADQILQNLPDPGNTFFRREVTAAVVTLAHHRGRPEIAWEEIRRRLPDGPDTEPGNGIHLEGLFLQRVAAELCLDNEDTENARAWLAAHDRWLVWSGAVLGRADGQLAWACLASAEGLTNEARNCAKSALDLAERPHQPIVQLRARRLLGEFAIREGNLFEAEGHLAASIELAAQCELPFERALTLLTQAEYALAASDHSQFLATLAEVRATLIPLRAFPALSRCDSLAARMGAPSATHFPAGLTQREVDVLRLLATHLRDKEIADQLFLSPRTVESHVAHILAKLGVDNRRAAAAAAFQLGLFPPSTQPQ